MKIIKNIIYWIVVIILLGLIGYFGYKTYSEYKDNNINTNIQTEIKENISIITDTNYHVGNYDESKFPTGVLDKIKEEGTAYNPPNVESSKFISADFSSLKQENLDTVAWLYVPGTEINYSVAQTIDNSYYLSHNFNKEYNRAGWIFGDYRSNFEKLNRNTVIYGHNQTTSSMFGDLKKLIKTEGWFNKEENRYIYLDTPNASYVFEVVSVYVTGDNKYIKHGLSDDKTYQEFIDYILKNNTIEGLSEDVDISDKILTLSTCHSGKRLTVQSKLIRTKMH